MKAQSQHEKYVSDKLFQSSIHFAIFATIVGVTITVWNIYFQLARLQGWVQTDVCVQFLSLPVNLFIAIIPPLK
jgi:hypothetical protein